MTDTIKILEFNDLPENVANEYARGEFPKNWTYGQGGYNLDNDQWHFNTVEFDDELNMHEKVYLIPKCINIIIKNECRNAVEDRLNSIKRELEL